MRRFIARPLALKSQRRIILSSLDSLEPSLMSLDFCVGSNLNIYCSVFLSIHCVNTFIEQRASKFKFIC